MTNEKALFEAWANRQGINKAEGSIIDISTASFGGIIPKPLVENLISLTRKQNAWLGAIDTRIRGRQSGEIPIVDWNEPATEFVGRNDGTKVITEPPTRLVPYAAKKFKSEFYVTTEELREAVQAGIENFESKMLEDWATQLGNDVANIVMNSDKSLDASTRMNRLLRALDGVDLQTDTGANITDALGIPWGQGIYGAMLDAMPERFAEDPGLRWMFNRRINIHWHNSLTNVNTTERMRSGLGDQAISTEILVPPLGLSQLIVPQISSLQGPAEVAPTSAGIDGAGIVFDLTILVGAGKHIVDVAGGIGRKIRVHYKASGITEIVTAVDDGGTLKASSLAKLGQTVVSTTNTDYDVRVADETDLYLLNPKGIVLIYVNEWRSYREFNKDFDRFEVTTYFEADTIVPIPETIVKFKSVSIVPIVTWNAG